MTPWQKPSSRKYAILRWSSRTDQRPRGQISPNTKKNSYENFVLQGHVSKWALPSFLSMSTASLMLIVWLKWNTFCPVLFHFQCPIIVSVIDKVINDKVAFKESSSDTADIIEKFVFIKVAGPNAGAVSNRRLFKRALTLMFKGSDYAKHFMRPHFWHRWRVS